MSRHPFSKYWKAPIAFLGAAVAAFAVLLWTHSYLFAIGTILMAIVGYVVYAVGESSDLPGTAGEDDKNVRT